MAVFQSVAMRPRKNWSHPIFPWEVNARFKSVMIGSAGCVHVGGVMRVLFSQLVMLLHMSVAMMSGVFWVFKWCQNVVIESLRALSLSSLGHRKTWLVSSLNCPQSKHRPSILLSIVCCQCKVGRRSCKYFDVWIRWPVESF